MFPDQAFSVNTFSVSKNTKTTIVPLKTLTPFPVLWTRPCVIWLLSGSWPSSCPSFPTLPYSMDYCTHPPFFGNSFSTEYISLSPWISVWPYNKFSQVRNEKWCMLPVFFALHKRVHAHSLFCLCFQRLRDRDTWQLWTQRLASTLKVTEPCYQPGPLHCTWEKTTHLLFKPINLGFFIWKQFILDST